MNEQYMDALNYRKEIIIDNVISNCGYSPEDVEKAMYTIINGGISTDGYDSIMLFHGDHSLFLFYTRIIPRQYDLCMFAK